MSNLGGMKCRRSPRFPFHSLPQPHFSHPFSCFFVCQLAMHCASWQWAGTARPSQLGQGGCAGFHVNGEFATVHRTALHHHNRGLLLVGRSGTALCHGVKDVVMDLCPSAYKIIVASVFLCLYQVRGILSVVSTQRWTTRSHNTTDFVQRRGPALANSRSQAAGRLSQTPFPRAPQESGLRHMNAIQVSLLTK